MIMTAAALLSGGSSILGSIFGHAQQKKQYYQQWLHNATVEAQQEGYRKEVIRYQNTVYKQDIKYGGQYLDWQKSEFARQGEMVEKATQNIQKNLFQQYATMLTRAVEENIAHTFNMDTTAREARKAQASARAAADAKGVEGSTIEQIIGDVKRQRGEAEGILEMNRSATMRQLNLEMLGLKASADQALYNIPIQTFSPSAPLAPPQPVSPVQPQAPLTKPSSGALAVNVVGGVLQGMQNYASWSGQTMRQAFKL